MSKEANGKLKKLANALKPLKMPLLFLMGIWGISGLILIVSLLAWALILSILAFAACIVAMIVDSEAKKEKKAGKQ